MEKRHGSAFDRGSADAYYGRPFNPHFYAAGTYTSPMVTELSDEQREEYRLGFVGETDRKEW